MRHPIVVAITGSSGVVYGQRLVEVMLDLDLEIELVISDSGRQVLNHELGLNIESDNFEIAQLIPGRESSGQLRHYSVKNFMEPIASGSHRTSGMVICPCSGATLSSVAHGSSRNLIERAADVHLKEKRPLILVPRETPLSLIYMDNMRTAACAGATILPASPGFYNGQVTVQTLVDFVVARVLDQLGIEHGLSKRWGTNPE